MLSNPKYLGLFIVQVIFLMNYNKIIELCKKLNVFIREYYESLDNY